MGVWRRTRPEVTQVLKALEGRTKVGWDQERLNLYTERNMRPRPVHESPYDYAFRSVNFDLLRILFGQIRKMPEVNSFRGF